MYVQPHAFHHRSTGIRIQPAYLASRVDPITATVSLWHPPIEQQHGVNTTLNPGKHPSKMSCPADAQPAERSCTMKRLVEIILEGHYRHSDAAMSPTTEMCKLGSSKELSYCHISITIIIGAALIREPAHEEYPVSWHSS